MFCIDPRMPFAATATIVMVLALTACSGKDDKTKSATQVAAKVNGGEISVHQINDVLARAGNVPADQARQASGKVLEGLIGQELLLQEAMEKKLDRTAPVVQAIEAAKREILARAYVDSVTAQAGKPDAAEVHGYYASNPLLFSARRIYNINELGVAIAADKMPALQERVDRAKSLNDVAAWLKEQNIPFNAGSGAKGAEQLPLNLVPRVAELRDGQIRLVTMPGGAAVLQLIASRDQPVDEQTARPAIEQFLANKKKSELAETEMKRLRAAAKIEYLGEFAASPGAPATSAQPATQPDAAPVASKDASAAHMEKGVRGLK